jgi:hypothetical protein
VSDADTYAYVGAQDAGTTVHPFNTTDFHIDQAIADVRTAQYAKVIRGAYDANGNDIPPGTIGPIGFVDVQPLVNQVDGNNGNSTPHGTIYKIPYFRYQSALGAIISNPKKDDIGEIIMHDRDTSVVRATGAQGNPGSRRRHDFADAVFHGSHIDTGTPTQGVAFSDTGVKIFDKNHNTVTLANNLITIKVGNATYTFDQNGLFTASGNVIAGQGGSDQVTLQGHQHTQPNDSHGDTEQPTNAPTAGT